MSEFARFANDERGAISIEYALIAAIVSVVMIWALNSMANSLNGMFSKVSSGLTSGK